MRIIADQIPKNLPSLKELLTPENQKLFDQIISKENPTTEVNLTTTNPSKNPASSKPKPQKPEEKQDQPESVIGYQIATTASVIVAATALMFLYKKQKDLEEFRMVEAKLRVEGNELRAQLNTEAIRVSQLEKDIGEKKNREQKEKQKSETFTTKLEEQTKKQSVLEKQIADAKLNIEKAQKDTKDALGKLTVAQAMAEDLAKKSQRSAANRNILKEKFLGSEDDWTEFKKKFKDFWNENGFYTGDMPAFLDLLTKVNPTDLDNILNNLLGSEEFKNSSNNLLQNDQNAVLGAFIDAISVFKHALEKDGRLGVVNKTNMPLKYVVTDFLAEMLKDFEREEELHVQQRGDAGDGEEKEEDVPSPKPSRRWGGQPLAGHGTPNKQGGAKSR